MPTFKKDKSKFQMKNMAYYKSKHTESENNSPYKQNEEYTPQSKKKNRIDSDYLDSKGEHIPQSSKNYKREYTPQSDSGKESGETYIEMKPGDGWTRTIRTSKSEYTPQTKSK